jgi:catechol 2,3-dioxygenase-like lactoylglutathione lyase family enzyme
MTTRPPIDSLITFLYTDDFDSSIQFYEHLLGFPLFLDQGTCRIYRVQGDAYLGVCQTGAGEIQHATRLVQGNLIVTLVTAEVDAWYQYLSAHGVIFEKTPAVNEKYRIYNCLFRDPNGYLIEIQRFLDID